MEARRARQAPESFFRHRNHCPAMGFSHILFPDGRFPARRARRGRTIAGQWGKRPSAYSPPPFSLSPRASPVTPIRRNPFFPLETNQIDLSARPSPLRWGNSPPGQSPSDGQRHLLGSQTPAPVARASPWKPLPEKPPSGKGDPIGMREARVARPMGGRANGRRREYACRPPRMCVRVYARARLYEKENYSKTTCCRPP